MNLRLLVVTDPALAAPRRIEDIVLSCLEAGAPAIQLRDKTATAGELLETARALRRFTSAYGALLFVNDRFDVALAAGADGVHLGPSDLPIEAVRRVVPDSFLIGFSTDDPGEAARAQAGGASYIGCGAVFGTTTKAEAAGERIGTDRLAQVVRAVTIPVIGIGGIRPANIAAVGATGAAGAAVVGAVMTAGDPGAVVRQLLAGLHATSA